MNVADSVTKKISWAPQLHQAGKQKRTEAVYSK